MTKTLLWRQNGRDDVSNHQPHECLLNRLFRRRSNKTSKSALLALCEGNSPVTGEFPAQRASNAEHVSIWWRHHVVLKVMHNRVAIPLISLQLCCHDMEKICIILMNMNPIDLYKSHNALVPYPTMHHFEIPLVISVTSHGPRAVTWWRHGNAFQMVAIHEYRDDRNEEFHMLLISLSLDSRKWSFHHIV